MRLVDVDELKEPVGSYNPVKWTSEYGYVISVEDIDHAPTLDTSKEILCTVNVNMNKDEVVERLKELGWEPVGDGRWIPCSERLPEDDTPVLVYLFEHNKSPYIAWLSDGRWYTEDFEVERENEPIAWMPLPEPYMMDEVEE